MTQQDNPAPTAPMPQYLISSILMGDLASETGVSVSNLPLATYPNAIKQAAALLHQNKPQGARAVLEVALDTLMVNRAIIPLPLVRARAAIERAGGLAQKANGTGADNAQLHTLLTMARTQLRLGEALGLCFSLNPPASRGQHGQRSSAVQDSGRTHHIPFSSNGGQHMKGNRKTILAGLGVLALTGAAIAAATEARYHSMQIALPDGGVAQIRYTGDVAPKVTITPADKATSAFAPLGLFTAFTPPSFAALDRISTEMDNQAEAMLRQADLLASGSPADAQPLDVVARQKLPAGTVRYSFISTSTGNGTCSKSVQLTSFGPGRAPKLVTQTSGDCADKAPLVATAAPGSAQQQPRVMSVRSQQPDGE